MLHKTAPQSPATKSVCVIHYHVTILLYCCGIEVASTSPNTVQCILVEGIKSTHNNFEHSIHHQGIAGGPSLQQGGLQGF